MPNHLCKEMLDLRKKASFFQGIGPNPLFAQEEQVFLRELFMRPMYIIHLGKDVILMQIHKKAHIGQVFSFGRAFHA